MMFVNEMVKKEGDGIGFLIYGWIGKIMSWTFAVLVVALN